MVQGPGRGTQGQREFRVGGGRGPTKMVLRPRIDSWVNIPTLRATWNLRTGSSAFTRISFYEGLDV